MPKANFPIFSILPINLIPACRDCNTDKLSNIANSRAEETIHPYFDELEDEHYLIAIVNHTVPVTFTFSIEAPDEWGLDLQSRLETHFEVFQLNKLYVTLAAQELSNINYRLTNLFVNQGTDAVEAYLFDGFETRVNSNKNSWQTAMYKAMYDSNWFHNNGHIF